MAGRLEDLLNIGPRTAGWLRDAGIESPDALARMGAVEAWRRLRQTAPGVDRNALYALEGALADVRWNALPPARRDALRAAADTIELEET